MRLAVFPVAGGGGRQVYVNPEQVVCLMDIGEKRTQIVTTGLAGEASVSLVVETPIDEVAAGLEAVS